MPTVTSENKIQFDLDELARKNIIKPIKLTEEELQEAKENLRTFKNVPNTSIDNIRQAFQEAIDYHTSLGGMARVINSKKAAKTIGNIIGNVKDSDQPKPLLGSNAKLEKSAKNVELPDDVGVDTWGLSLTPAFNAGGIQGCKNANLCISECLGTESGRRARGGVDPGSPQYLSMLKTRALLTNPKEFATRLYSEIEAKRAEAHSDGNHLGLRLNTLSDIDPRVWLPLMKAFPDVTFYDYTKNIFDDALAPNHHLTYSVNGLSQPAGLNGNKIAVNNKYNNWDWIMYRLNQGHNVAMVFTRNGRKDTAKEHIFPKFVDVPWANQTFDVVDGMTHDFRPLDQVAPGQKGKIIGLASMDWKGSWDEAHKDSKGFMVYYDPKRIKDFSNPEVSASGKKTYKTIATNDTYVVAPQPPSRPLIGNNGEKISLADKIAHDKLLGLAPPGY